MSLISLLGIFEVFLFLFRTSSTILVVARH